MLQKSNDFSSFQPAPGFQLFGEQCENVRGKLKYRGSRVSLSHAALLTKCYFLPFLTREFR